MESVVLSPPPLYFVIEYSKNTRNELARPVMGTIFLVINVIDLYIIIKMNFLLIKEGFVVLH